ncbi:MAG: 2-oxoacid:acceptor oxidoreductase subunit alpha [SAR202 cluster bacterium]|nr:MAG: 2-oxoacid:acceptor oxidoreductase subunit alpha [SAR202 cluster bacterium]
MLVYLQWEQRLPEKNFLEDTLKKQDFVVRFAGEGGQGVVTSAEGLAQAMAQSGYHVQTFSTFPSQIRGGPTWTQTRISTKEVLSSGDELDVLVAFNQYAYDNHKDDVASDGVIVYNSGEFEIEASDNALAMDFDELAKQTGNNRAANFVVMGALAELVDLPINILEDFNRQRYTRGRDSDQQIIDSNNMALSLGSAEATKSGFNLGELADPIKPEGDQVLLNGNIAISMGAAHAGLDTFIGYPISPATPILLWMEQNLVGEGKFVHQSSSEIESITSIVGAGFAGKKAMTSTAGPGFTLMGEGIGLAWMAEIPVVVVDVQRGGPSTGLPTKTEQSDLLTALYPGHGDMKMPVIAPGTVEECFIAGVKSVNWAERYQGPVVILSEHALSERRQNIPRPDLASLGEENRKVYEGSNGYLRYDGWELSPMPIPGGPGAYVANGSEHDAMGDTTHLPARHIQMTERRFSKLLLLDDGTFESENESSNIALVPWGGSKGPALDAFNELREEGVDLSWYYTMYIHPMPEEMLTALKQKDLVIVPELNYMGQFASVLRGEGINAVAITQYTGLPFKVRDLVANIKELMDSAVKDGATV